ncbi:MAG TPA: M20/M25/M40 family metallo-hydrolase [Pyrinomonadaceae bacterium]|nr:M20/M25/M40 family metallo-hydrolase [Pyrinomonadaceae bacterium]
MLRRHVTIVLLLSILLVPGFHLAAQQPSPAPQTSVYTPRDANDPIERIKAEGLNHSQLMQTLEYLTDVIGPRLTGSPNMKRANEWTRQRLAGWGLQNAHLEAWGPFGRGWELKRFSAEVIEPQDMPLIAYPRAWSPGLAGTLTADVVYVDTQNEEQLQKYRGKLRGAIVLTSAPRQVKARFDPDATRLSDQELLELANAPDPAQVKPRPRRAPRTPEQRAQEAFNDRKTRFYYEEGAALLVDASRAGDGGTLQFVQSASVPQPFDTPTAKRVYSWQVNAPKILPQMTVSIEQYNRMVRLIQQGVRVRMSVKMDVQFHDEDLMGYNTIAEIPGSDLQNQIVMLGAHMDSWHTATGATDNGAGVAVMMEAVRILQTLGLKPRRTIRIGLWSGEEQGEYGSEAYVKQHFGELEPQPTPSPAAAAASPTPEAQPAVAPSPSPTPIPRLVKKTDYENFDVYFNLDNGTGRVRGIYLQGNEAVRPIFRRWLESFRDMGASTLSIRIDTNTDHEPFDTIGLPAFNLMQDEIEYGPRTWHTNMDVFDRVQEEDMKQAAIVMAALVYNSAMSDERIPRKFMQFR